MAARTDPLAEYNARRDFKATPEPAGQRKGGKGGNLFIVQKHDATRTESHLSTEFTGARRARRAPRVQR